MKISIIGTGYVGLVSGACLAEKGHKVVCVDIDQEKVDRINSASPPIYEHGLADLLKKNVPRKLKATADLQDAVLNTDISMIAVGTPSDGGQIDLKFVRDAARQIGGALRRKCRYHVVVVKSTVVPGTTEDIVRPILEEESGMKAGADFGLGMNPEFLREGEAIRDFMFPDRIVLGGIDERSIHTLEKLYGNFRGVDKLRTNPRTAEMIKYTANSLLATMISFANEIGNLCAALPGIDVVEVMKGVHLDRRICPILPDGRRIVPALTTYIEAGCGFGGSCFPKDVKALIAHGKKLGKPMRLLDAVIHVNERQPKQVVSLLKRNFPTLKGIPIAILGLAFKPGTDDIRESPAIPIVRELIAQKAELKAYDPIARHEAEKLFGNRRITYCDDLVQTVRDAKAVVLLTRWDEFRNIPELLAHSKSQPLFIDGRRMLRRDSIARYVGIGMGT